jgi:hypothetical protein
MRSQDREGRPPSSRSRHRSYSQGLPSRRLIGNTAGQFQDDGQLQTVLLAVPATGLGQRFVTTRVIARRSHGGKATSWPSPNQTGQSGDLSGQPVDLATCQQQDCADSCHRR